MSVRKKKFEEKEVPLPPRAPLDIPLPPRFESFRKPVIKFTDLSWPVKVVVIYGWISISLILFWLFFLFLVAIYVTGSMI